MQRTRASIGYVEYAYAKAHRLSDVSLRDADGTYIRADASAFAAALVSAGGMTSGTGATTSGTVGSAAAALTVFSPFHAV